MEAIFQIACSNETPMAVRAIAGAMVGSLYAFFIIGISIVIYGIYHTITTTKR